MQLTSQHKVNSASLDPIQRDVEVEGARPTKICCPTEPCSRFSYFSASPGRAPAASPDAIGPLRADGLAIADRVGAKRLLHMHCQLKSAWCRACDARMAWADAMGHGPACPECGVAGSLRPNIVWFGEMLAGRRAA